MYSMKETYQMTNLSYETLKFYCNEGLVPNVKRDRNNHRIFDDKDVNWIKSLSCLKNCGMSINEMKEFLNLCLLGESSIPQRKVILPRKRANLLNEISHFEEAIAYIDWKQSFYDDLLSGKTKYYNNLIDTRKS